MNLLPSTSQFWPIRSGSKIDVLELEKERINPECRTHFEIFLEGVSDPGSELLYDRETNTWYLAGKDYDQAILIETNTNVNRLLLMSIIMARAAMGQWVKFDYD